MELNFKNYLNLTKSADYLQLHQYYTQSTVYDVLGVARQENSHSSFIRWILDPAASHQLKEEPLRRFIQTLCLAREKLYVDESGTDYWKGTFENNFAMLDKNYPEIYNALRYGNYEIDNIKIDRERIIKKKRRADIYATLDLIIKGKDKCIIPFVLLIENKVNSYENKNQTCDYAKAVFEPDNKNQSSVQSISPCADVNNTSNTKYPTFIGCCIYLTAYKSSEIKNALEDAQKGGTTYKKLLPSSPEFLCLNYQYLLDGVVEPMESVCTDPAAKEWLTEYIRVLGQAIKENENNDSSEYVMAISQKEKDYAQALWDNMEFRGVILSIFESLNPQNKSFSLNKSEERFWESLAYCYSVMIPAMLMDAKYSETETNEVKKLEAKVNSIGSSSGIREFYYTRNDGKRYLYRGHSERNIGMLCRDIIEDVIEAKELNRQEIDGLRKELQKYNLNWLREVILFDNEVPRDSDTRYFDKSISDKKYTELLKNEGKIKKGVYKTYSREEFSYAFFSAADKLRRENKSYDVNKFNVNDEDTYNLEIILADGTKCYVAKFWGSDDIPKLIEIIKKKYQIDVKVEAL